MHECLKTDFTHKQSVSKSHEGTVLFNFREPHVIFSGAMLYDRAGRTPCITVMMGKTTTVLEMQLMLECIIRNKFLISEPKHMLWVLKRTV